jgi:hypothetical protein
VTVEVVLTGGLGNQLFGYALGLELSVRSECDLILRTGALGHRVFELDSFELGPQVVIGDRYGQLGEFAGRAIGRLSWQRRFITERSFSFDPKILAAKSPVKLHGYFQSWKYFPTVIPQVLGQIARVVDPSPDFLRLHDELSSKRFVSVQVRRGDYLEHLDYHGICHDNYYHQALHGCLKWDELVVVFTDDDTSWVPPWIDGQDALIIRPRDLPRPIESLVLMGLAEHWVIANSSFGWWGAMRGSRSGGTVIAPRPWFAAEGLDTRDLLPPDWLTLDCRAS